MDTEERTPMCLDMPYKRSVSRSRITIERLIILGAKLYAERVFGSTELRNISDSS